MKSQAVYETELNLDLKQRVPHRAEGQLKYTLDAYGEIEQSFDQEKEARLGEDGLQFQYISYRTLKKIISLLPIFISSVLSQVGLGRQQDPEMMDNIWRARHWLLFQQLQMSPTPRTSHTNSQTHCFISWVRF